MEADDDLNPTDPTGILSYFGIPRAFWSSGAVQLLPQLQYLIWPRDENVELRFFLHDKANVEGAVFFPLTAIVSDDFAYKGHALSSNGEISLTFKLSCVIPAFGEFFRDFDKVKPKKEIKHLIPFVHAFVTQFGRKRVKSMQVSCFAMANSHVTSGLLVWSTDLTRFGDLLLYSAQSQAQNPRSQLSVIALLQNGFNLDIPIYFQSFPRSPGFLPTRFARGGQRTMLPFYTNSAPRLLALIGRSSGFKSPLASLHSTFLQTSSATSDMAIQGMDAELDDSPPIFCHTSQLRQLSRFDFALNLHYNGTEPLERIAAPSGQSVPLVKILASHRFVKILLSFLYQRTPFGDLSDIDAFVPKTLSLMELRIMLLDAILIYDTGVQVELGMFLGDKESGMKIGFGILIFAIIAAGLAKIAEIIRDGTYKRHYPTIARFFEPAFLSVAGRLIELSEKNINLFPLGGDTSVRAMFVGIFMSYTTHSQYFASEIASADKLDWVDVHAPKRPQTDTTDDDEDDDAGGNDEKEQGAEDGAAKRRKIDLILKQTAQNLQGFPNLQKLYLCGSSICANADCTETGRYKHVKDRCVFCSRTCFRQWKNNIK